MPACDGQTDGQTDGRIFYDGTPLYVVHAWRAAIMYRCSVQIKKITVSVICIRKRRILEKKNYLMSLDQKIRYM